MTAFPIATEVCEKYPHYMTAEQTAECLGCSRETFRIRRNQGKINLKLCENGKYLRDAVIQFMLEDAGLIDTGGDNLPIEDQLLQALNG